MLCYYTQTIYKLTKLIKRCIDLIERKTHENACCNLHQSQSSHEFCTGGPPPPKKKAQFKLG